MDRKEVGKRIRDLREKRGWKKGTLATKAGVAPSYISILEKGEKCPTVETLDSICFAFGISLADFFSEKKDVLDEDKIAALSERQKGLLNDFLKSL